MELTAAALALVIADTRNGDPDTEMTDSEALDLALTLDHDDLVVVDDQDTRDAYRAFLDATPEQRAMVLAA